MPSARLDSNKYKFSKSFIALSWDLQTNDIPHGKPASALLHSAISSDRHSEKAQTRRKARSKDGLGERVKEVSLSRDYPIRPNWPNSPKRQCSAPT